MRTKKTVWSVALSLLFVLAMVLGLVFTAQAQPEEKITFSITIDNDVDTAKWINKPYAGTIAVKYTVVENTGVDALQLTIAYDKTAFELDSVWTNDSTPLGAATTGEGDSKANITFDNVKTAGSGAVYTGLVDDDPDTLIIAYFTVKGTATPAAAYQFGFVDANNENGGYSTAWRGVKTEGQSSTHTPVAIDFNTPTIYIKGDFQFELANHSKVYDGTAAQDSEIAIVNASANAPEDLTRVWFVQDGETYTKLDANPINVGTYYVVLQTAGNDYWNAYCGYEQSGDVYTLTDVAGKVAEYTITPRAITIAFDDRSEQYQSFDNETFAGYLAEEGYVTIGNLVSGESVTVALDASGILNANIGDYYYGLSGAGVVLVSLTDAPNYTIGTVDGVFTIEAKEIELGFNVTATFVDGSFPYDGTEKTIAATIAEEFAGIMNVSYSGGEAGCAGNGAIHVGDYTITATFTLTSANYTFKNGQNTLTAVLSITTTALSQEEVDELVENFVSFYAVDDGVSTELTITNKTGAYQKTYDAKSAYIGVVVANNEKLSQQVDYKVGDSGYTRLAAVLENFADYAETNANTYIVKITFLPGEGYAFDVNVDAEYTITLTINRQTLTITATSEVQYSDAAVITVDNGTDAWIGSENYATYGTSAAALAEYVVSTYENTMTAGTVYEIAWADGAEAAIEAILTNYDVTLAVVQDLTVAKKIINAVAYDFEGYEGTYDGAAHTLTVVGADAIIQYVITEKASVKDVADSGTYTATITLADPDNYTFEDGDNNGWTVDEGNVSATKTAPVSISTVELQIEVAYTAKTAAFAITGFVGGETDVVLTDLAYLADGESANITDNVYTINGYVANAIVVTATSQNTNYTIASKTLKNIRKVEYLAGEYDAEVSGEDPVLPGTDLLFDGFTTEEPGAVALNHYAFIRFATDANNTGAFDFTQAIQANTQIYAIWEIKNQYTLTLVYMIEGDVTNLIQLSQTAYYEDDVIRYNGELPSLAVKDWFKVEEWFRDSALTVKFVGGVTLNQDTTLYANYKFNIGLGDVNGDGFVNANDITLYRQWIVGGYTMEVVESGTEWACVNSDDFDIENIYFIKRVADSNALTAESVSLGDNHLDIRDVSTIRMALVGGYGFSVLEGKYVDGEEIVVTRSIITDNASDLLILAKSGKSVQPIGDITEENFVGAANNCAKDVVIDLNGHTLTLKSLRITLAAGNTGKIEIKNGSIYVADGNGVVLSAPNGSVILDNVTLYDKDGEFTIQAADHSLHFVRTVEFLKDDNGAEVPAAVKVEKDTHVVVEETAEITVEKIVVTENYEIATSEDAEISLTVRGDHEEIVIEGNFRNEITTLNELVAAAAKGGEYTLAVDLTYNGQVGFTNDTILDLNGHTIRSMNNVALSAGQGATLTINDTVGTGAIVAQEACVMAFNGSTVEINGGTYTAIDNFVIGTNGSTGKGGNTITINAGTFNGGIQSAGYVACGIYVANNDTVTVNGGTFNITNGVGILARSGDTTVGENVVFHVTGNGTLGKVGDSQVTVPSGEIFVWDLLANYPGGAPTFTNNGSYEVVALVDSMAEIKTVANTADVIVLENDADGTGSIVFAKDTTLNLNGHTIRSTDDVAIKVTLGATLTIEDTVGTGAIIAQEACVMAFNGSTIEINGGTYTAIDNFVVGTNGTAGQGDNTITINAGTFNGGIQTAGYVACGIYVANNDTVTVNGGTFNVTNGVGILARSGNTTVGENVVFHVTGNGTLGKVGDSQVTVPSGEVLVIDYAANYPGGEPTLTNDSAYEAVAVIAATPSVTVVPVVRTYEQLSAASGSIVLGADIDCGDHDITYTEDLTIDLKGYNVTFNSWGFEVTNGATLTMNGTGSVTAGEAALYATRAATLIVNGGTYTSYDNFVIGTNGSAGIGGNVITVNGGTFNGNIQSAGYVACGIYVANNDTVTVNGGTFNVENGVGILARSGNTTVGENVVINVTGNGTLGKVGDSRVVLPAGAELVLDLAANYPGGDPTLVNGTAYGICRVVGTVEELSAAFAAGGNVVLGADIANVPYVAILADTTLNLNGHNLSFTKWGLCVDTESAAPITLTVNGNGNVSAVYCLDAEHGNCLVVNGGTYTATECAVVAYTGGNVTINGGTFNALDNSVISTNGTEGWGGNVITVNGGIFNGNIQSAGYVACGIYVANNDTVTVNGGTFNVENGVGILARSGNTTVGADVVFNVTGNGDCGKVGDSRVVVPSGEELVIDYAANYPGGEPVLVNENGNCEIYTVNA